MLALVQVLQRQISDSRKIFELYKKVRNSSFKVTDQEVFTYLPLLKTMDERTLAHFSYLLVYNFSPTNEYNTHLLNFQSSVSNRLQSFNDLSFIRLVSTLQFAYTKKFDKFTKEMLQGILDRAKRYEDDVSMAQLLMKISKLFTHYKINEIKYEDFFIHQLEKMLANSYDDDILKLLDIAGKVCINSEDLEIKTKNEAVFKILEDKVKSQYSLKKIPENETMKVLKNLHYIKSIDEDFLRELESSVLNKIASVSLIKINQLLRSYKHRKTHDYHYMINSVYKKFYEDFLTKIQSTTELYYLSQYFSYYIENSFIYGSYSDYKVIEEIYSYLKNKRDVIAKNPQVIRHNFFISILAFINFYSNDRKNEILGMVLENVMPELEMVENKYLLVLGNELSKNLNVPKDFWEHFARKIDEIVANEKRISYLYAIHLNLRLQNPQAYAYVQSAFQPHIANLESIWKLERQNDLAQSTPSDFHLKAIQVLNKLNIPNHFEYYDEYFIDIACPTKKLAYEVLGPGHYIFPECLPNGRTCNKIRNLQALGWKHIPIPFFKQRSSLGNLEDFFRSTFPLE